MYTPKKTVNSNEADYYIVALPDWTQEQFKSFFPSQRIDRSSAELWCPDMKWHACPSKWMWMLLVCVCVCDKVYKSDWGDTRTHWAPLSDIPHHSTAGFTPTLSTHSSPNVRVTLLLDQFQLYSGRPTPDCSPPPTPTTYFFFHVRVYCFG